MDMRFTPVFWRLYEAAEKHPLYISMPGGTRSGKTYAILQFLHLLIPRADKTGDVTSVVSETLPHLKKGAIRDFENILGHPLSSDPRWNATDHVYTYPNGAKLEFFSADTPGKVLGPGRKRLVLNECNHISYEIARQLFVRTTGLIIMDYNPAATFWAIEKIEPLRECITFGSTYKDNTFLTPAQIARIEANKDDPNWWKVYGLGQLGELKGVIYTFTQIDTMPEPDDHLSEVWGIDFGFKDPSAIARILADRSRKIAYIREEAYRAAMFNSDISLALKEAGCPDHVNVWSDCAEPKSIAEIAADTGLKVQACDKTGGRKTDRRKFQIQWLQGWKFFITKDSVNIIRDFRNYCWELDSDGRETGFPVHTFSHGPDAVRYALYTEFAGNEGSGDYCISSN